MVSAPDDARPKFVNSFLFLFCFVTCDQLSFFLYNSDDGGEAVRSLSKVQHPGPDVEHPGGGAGDAAGRHILPRPRQSRPGADGKEESSVATDRGGEGGRASSATT